MCGIDSTQSTADESKEKHCDGCPKSYRPDNESMLKYHGDGAEYEIPIPYLLPRQRKENLMHIMKGMR